MRNIRLIALIFLTTTTYNILFSAEAENKNDIAIGTNITLPASNILLEGNLFLKDDFWKQDLCLENLENLDFGFAFGIKDFSKKNSINLKIGKLTYGGILSSLNNPLISSSISPFSISGCRISNLTAILPNISSSRKPVSYAFFSEVNNVFSSFAKINFSGFYTPDERAVVNLSTAINGKKTTLKFSNINNLFYWNGNTNLSWFSKDFYSMTDFYFPSQMLFSSNNQICIEKKNYSGFLSAGFFENPFGSFNTVWKIENKIIFHKNILNISMLINKNPLFTISGNGKKIENCFQAKGNFQHQFIVKKKTPYFCKAGLTAYYKLPLISDTLTQEIKTGGGIQITNHRFRFSSNFGYELFLEDAQVQSEEYNLQLKYLLYLRKIITGLNCNFSAEIKGNNFSTTENFKVTTTFLTNPKIYISINYSLTQKNAIAYKTSWNAAISTKFDFNKSNLQAKISLE